MPTLLSCLVIFIVWLFYKKSKAEKAQKQTSDEFWKREQKANTTRKKDLSDLHYITVPFDTLPFHKDGDEELIDAQNSLLALRDAKIVNFGSLSNTDLKLEYGTANINELTLYDQNYLLLIRGLNKWGQLLLTQNHAKDAKTVFAYAVSIGSDISATFLSLAKIYQEEHSDAKLQELIATAQNLTSLTKDSLLAKLNALS